jgi:O-antigen/teichoic acid export membrane protein
MVVALVAVPFQIRLLGPEAYGLIGFGNAMQALLIMLDLGMAPAVSRLIARSNDTKDSTERRDLFATMTFVYWTLAGLIAITLCLLAPLIGRHWLNLGKIDPNTVVVSLTLLALQIAVRWPTALYYGILTGSQQIVTPSLIQAAYFTFANIGGLLVIALFMRTVTAFFAWQIVAALFYTLTLRQVALTAVGGSGGRFRCAEIARIWVFSSHMTGVTLASILLTQVDKFILSSIVTLKEFGYYTIATLLASSLYRVTTPLYNVMYPRFCRLVAVGDETALEQQYSALGNLFAIFWFPGVMALSLAARPIVLLWTGHVDVADATGPVFALLVLGTGLHGVLFFPYALQLAYGATGLTLRIHLALVVIQVPLTIALTNALGIIGAATAWLTLFALYAVIAIPVTHRRMLQSLAFGWPISDIGRPMIISIIIGSCGWWTLQNTTVSPLAHILVCGGLAVSAVLTSLAFSPHSVPSMWAALAD